MKKFLKPLFIFSLILLHLQISAEIKDLEIPAHSQKDQIIRHTAYTLKYNEKYEQAEWLAYRLTANDLAGKTKRKNSFKYDTAVKTWSATPEDYRKSGYDRGHLAPAADMKRSKKAMRESFLMSNISPQDPNFNKGIWKKLEEQVRDWVGKNGELYIVTAGILQGKMKTIGKNRVAVPNYFYKALLDYKKPELKAIAFVIQNKSSKEPLYRYAVSIDSLEKVTGINFFAALPDKTENKLEASFDLSKWPMIPQCKGITKKGKRCKKKVRHPSGYCKSHR